MKLAARAILVLCPALLLLPLAALAQENDDPPPRCAWHTQKATLRMDVTIQPPGAWATWWCPTDAYSPWTAQYTAVRFSLLLSDRKAAIAAAIDAKDMASLIALRDRSVWGPELHPIIVQSFSATLASEPPPPTWLVAKNGIFPTRPAYAFVNQVRSTTSTGRATVGASCDCRTVRSVEGSTTYCATNQEQTLVAVCTRTN